jgi:hypothetical protein
MLGRLDCKNQQNLANALRIPHVGVAIMQAVVECPSCGKKYQFDERLAGRTFSCRRCGDAVHATAPVMPSPDALVLRFACTNCGKGVKVASEHAGKKTVCSNCGAEIRIPGGAQPVAPNKSAQRSAIAAAVSAPPPPAPPQLDVYGLEDAPPAALVPGGQASPFQASVQNDFTHAGSEPSLPSRDHYKPLSEGKKKQINKRADKLNLLKPTSAGLGISFGAVLGFALLGWRLYRIMHRFERAAARSSAEQSAPEHMVIDFKTFVAALDKETEQTIASPNTKEARDWLDPAKHPKHTVVKMSAEDARTMVAGFYERGAQGVYILEPSNDGDVVMASEFAVKLPQEPAQRQKCLEWAAKYEGGGPPSPDHGQKYVTISTDE